MGKTMADAAFLMSRDANPKVSGVKLLGVIDSMMFLCRRNQEQTSFECHYVVIIWSGSPWLFTSGGCLCTSWGKNNAESRTLIVWPIFPKTFPNFFS